MKKSRFFSAVLFVSLLFVLLPATAKAAMWDVPVGPGESFRWVFVTSTDTDATSPSIDYYNDFVNAAADDAGTPITGVVGKSSISDIQWKAIGSTSSTHAVENIGFSPLGIYNPMGEHVAGGTTDMFDSFIIFPIIVTELGSMTESPVWTGSSWDGSADAVGPLGGGLFTMYGLSWTTDYRWIQYSGTFTTEDNPLYAISEDLTVVPIPGTLILAATGMLSATLGLKRLRRKQQE